MTGNLYIKLNVADKHGIWREGIHLCSNISIDYTQAILGAIVKVSYNCWLDIKSSTNLKALSLTIYTELLRTNTLVMVYHYFILTKG